MVFIGRQQLFSYICHATQQGTTNCNTITMSNIKAIFFDIDGTLVSFKTHRIPASTLDALERLREKGIKLFIATGRPKSIVNNLGDFNFDGYVTLNGGVCIVDGKTIFSRSLPQDDTDMLIEQSRGGERFPCIYVLDDAMALTGGDAVVDNVMRMLDLKMPQKVTTEAIRGKRAYQVLAFFSPEEETEIMRLMPGSVTTRWNDAFTDIIPAGSSKSVGMEKILGLFGIKREECMAFGDGGNDIEMLRYAGCGIAMGGSSLEVQAAADYITDNVDNDGILKALVRFGVLER